MITRTDEVATALEAARRRWPGLTDTELLYRLIGEGYRALRHDTQARRQCIMAGAGALSGMYEPDYLDELRADWPE